jgi:hypothetical protein
MRSWQSEKDNTGVTSRHGNSAPNAVTPVITHDFPLLHFLPHAVCHLWYDGAAHEHGSRTPGREETRWTLWQSWIR